ncbi:MAG: signal recognition particle-docking protein FtsY [Armatimonadota bacterium]
MFNSWHEKLKTGLSKTKAILLTDVKDLVGLGTEINDELWEEFTDILVASDFGVKASNKVIDDLKLLVKENKIKERAQLLEKFKQELKVVLESNTNGIILKENKLNIFLVIGINGVGKTTSIAKLAHNYLQQGKKVVLACADTFRAAAGDQLQIWAKRLNIDLIKYEEGSDPAAVVFDGIKAAQSREADLLIVDTAGRLHTKVNLLEELKKIDRIIKREAPDSHRETLLVLDANIGQNSFNQAKVFQEAMELTGVVLTKLDSTARGGMVFSIKNELGIPIKFIGVGETLDDLKEFNPGEFVDALFE